MLANMTQVSDVAPGPLVIEGVIARELRKLFENVFPFIFSLMVRWIQMIFGIQMYLEEMQVKFEYGCDPIIIIEGVIVLGRRKLLENEFPFIFSVMVRWIQMILVYRCIMKRCRSSSNIGATQLLLKELLPLDLANFLKMIVSVHLFSDGLMESNYT
jgi:hypothetical protein